MQTYGKPQFKDPPKFLRLLKHRKLTILLGISFVAVILVTFSNKGLLRRFLLEAEVSDKKESILAIQQDIAELKKRRTLLQTDDFEIERVAREEHGMIRPGDVVYIIKSSDDEEE